jgi:hypothetical protein
MNFEHEPMATRRRVWGASGTPGFEYPPPELHDVMNFFEHMGHLPEGKYLNLEDVSVEFHYRILHIWADAKKRIKSEQAENSLHYLAVGGRNRRLLR